MDTKTASDLLNVIVREYGLGQTKMLLNTFGVIPETLLEALDNIYVPDGYSKKIARIKLARKVLGCNLVTAKGFVEMNYPNGERVNV